MTSAAGHVSNSPTVKWVIVTLENETVRGLFKVCFSAGHSDMLKGFKYHIYEHQLQTNAIAK